MAKPFGSAIDLKLNEIQNVRVQNISGNHASTLTGLTWYDVTANVWKYYDDGTNGVETLATVAYVTANAGVGDMLKADNLSGLANTTTARSNLGVDAAGTINYTHPSADGSKHVPANSTTNNGKVLTASGVAGTYTWETPVDTTYVAGDFDHDSLASINADEHIDWTLTNAKNIHTNNYTNTTYVAGDFDHDSLASINADEHIDWTLTNAKNIHVDNYTNTDTTYVAGDFAHDSLASINADEHIDWTLTNAKNIHTDNYTNTTYSEGDGGLTQINFTTALNTKLGNISTNVETLTLPASTTISAFGKTLVDDADAPAARTTLGVDVAGTDNSTDVSVVNTGGYLSFVPATQVLTANTLTNADISDWTTAVNASVAAFISTAAVGNTALDTAAEFIAKIQANADSLASLPQRHNEDFGDAAATSFAITHNFGTVDVLVEVVEKSTGETWGCDVTRTNTNVVTLDFGAVVPTLNQFRVVIRD